MVRKASNAPVLRLIAKLAEQGNRLALADGMVDGLGAVIVLSEIGSELPLAELYLDLAFEEV